MKTLLIVLGGMLLRDLWVWGISKFFCWRKCRQTQRRAEQERLQRRREADEKAAQIAARPRVITNGLVQRVKAYPFVIEPNTEEQVVLAFREITCALRAEDKTRFLASIHAGSEEVN